MPNYIFHNAQKSARRSGQTTIHYMLCSSLRLHCWKIRICCSTTWSMYCFCASSFVDALKFWTVSLAATNDSVSSHSETRTDRKLSSRRRTLKNVRDTVRSEILTGKSVSKCEPRSAMSFVAGSEFSSLFFSSAMRREPVWWLQELNTTNAFS